MQVHYYKTTWGKAWQKYNQKKHGYNPKFADVKPLNKRKKRRSKPKAEKEHKTRQEVFKERREQWEKLKARKNEREQG